MPHCLHPPITVCEREERAALSPEVHRLGIERGGLTKHGRPGLLWQAVDHPLPRLPAVSRAVDTQPVHGVVILVGLLRDHDGYVRVGRIQHDREAERAGEPVSVEPLPRVAPVVGAIDATVVLLPEPLGPRRVEQQLVNALPNVWVWIRNQVELDVLVLGGPRSAAVVTAEGAPAGHGDVHALQVAGVELNRMEHETAARRRPAVSRRVLENPADSPPTSRRRRRSETGRPGRPPRYSVPGSSGRPGRTCHVASTITPDSSGKLICRDRRQVLPPSA